MLHGAPILLPLAFWPLLVMFFGLVRVRLPTRGFVRHSRQENPVGSWRGAWFRSWRRREIAS